MIRRVLGAIGGAIRGWKLTTTDQSFISWLGGGNQTDAGVSVNADTAMRLATVFACIQKISKTVAQIPRHVILNNNGKKEFAKTHPLYSVIHHQANPRMSSFQFFQTMQWHATSQGNGFAEIIRDQRGRVLELWPWAPNKVRVEQDGWDLKIFFQTKTGERLMADDQVFHLPGICTSGRIGLSPIQAARETLGEGIALQQHSGRSLKNGMRASGMIETDAGGKFANEEAKQKWMKQFRESLTGENAYKIGMLQSGMKFVPTTITNEDAQWLEARKFNQSEICSIFDLPPHIIGNLEKATFSNIEQQSLEFILFCIAPWLINWEQQIELQLLLEEERQRYSAKFNFDGLLRGDSNSRWNAYWKAIQVGAMSPNEIRDLEELNPYTGGDQKFMMKNLQSIDGKQTMTLPKN